MGLAWFQKQAILSDYRPCGHQPYLSRSTSVVLLQKWNCLRYAVVRGHLELVELLLACGADESALDDKARICLSQVQSLNLSMQDSACSVVHHALSSCEYKVTWQFDPESLMMSQDSLCM